MELGRFAQASAGPACGAREPRRERFLTVWLWIRKLCDMKALLLSIAIVNLLAGVGVIVMGDLGLGINETVTYSKFRELELRKIINHEALRNHDVAQLAPDDASALAA